MSLHISNNLNDRRLLLRLLVKLMIWISLLAGAWILFTPLFKNDTPVNARVVESVVDVSEMMEGDVEIVEWFGKPLIIVHRTRASEDQLLIADNNVVRDPLSIKSSQPQFATNRLRSATLGWFVTIGLGTGSGCALKYLAANNERINGRAWSGGFVDGCDGSRYDLAGRVLVNQSARKNTTVPVWRLSQGKLIVSTGQ